MLWKLKLEQQKHVVSSAADRKDRRGIICFEYSDYSQSYEIFVSATCLHTFKYSNVSPHIQTFKHWMANYRAHWPTGQLANWPFRDFSFPVFGWHGARSIPSPDASCVLKLPSYGLDDRGSNFGMGATASRFLSKRYPEFFPRGEVYAAGG
jgi:hypothetical protein